MTALRSASDIARSLGRVTRSGRGFLVPCPNPNHGKGRGDRNPSCSICDGDNGRLVIHCFGGCDHVDVHRHAIALGWVQDRQGHPVPHWKPRPAPKAEARMPCDEAGDGRAEGQARKGNLGIIIARRWHTIVETYLSMARGIPGSVPQSLRFHPNIWHNDVRQELPAMVACAVRLGVGITGLLITYLQADGTGKAGVEPAKRMTGVIKGSGVWLSEESEPRPIAVAEGIETALSVQAATGIPAVAALSAYALPSLVLPVSVRHVLIAADPGNVGEEWASRAADRWHREGRSVSIALPRGNK